MKETLGALGAILVVIGWVAVALAIISGIGVAIYSLGVLEMTVGASLWAGFVIWMKCFFGGLISFSVGAILLK